MENVVLKANRYRIVDNSAFEMPLPLKFTVWKADAPICDYLISEKQEVSYTIITRYKELMITTIHRSLNISDIYYLFSCRVFQDKTPFTYPILDRMGIEKYNVYNIIQLTHGITPYDDYWIRFDGEQTTFEQACEAFDNYLIAPEAQPIPLVSYPSGEFRPGRSARPSKPIDADVSSILNQHKVDVASIMEESQKPVSIVPETSYAPATEVENNKMSQDDIEALLRSVGISEDSSADDPTPDFGYDPVTRSQEEPSGGKMSQEDIEKLLAANAPAAEPAPEPKTAPASGGMMSQEDIEKLLAANAPAAEPAPEPETVPASGGKMSQEDIEKLLAANAPAAEPVPEPDPAPASGGKMSQEDIEKLLAANAPAAEPAPEPETAPASGGKMSQEDIEKLLAANAPAAEPAPEPDPAPASGGKMSQEDIEKLLAANAPAAEPAPEPETAPASGGKMSQADIEALLNSMQDEANK